MGLLNQLQDIRLAIGDTAKTKYSDYQIVSTLNAIIRQANKVLSNVTSDLVKKRVTLTLADGVIDLPVDFQAIIRITDASNIPLVARTTENEVSTYIFEVIDNQIIANVAVIILTYKKFFTDIDLEYDENNEIVDKDLPLPNFFKDTLTVYTKATLDGTVTPEPLDTVLKRLVVGRDKGRINTKMPFRV